MAHPARCLRRFGLAEAHPGRRMVLVATLASMLAPAIATGGVLQWQDFQPGGARFQRPTEDLTALAPGGPVPYSALSIFVDTSGVYELTSTYGLFDDSFDGMVFLYAEAFDPGHPLDNLIAGNDDGSQPGTSELQVLLTAGVIYQVVTTVKTEPDAFGFTNRVSGPGVIRESACFLDDPLRFDGGTEISLAGGKFCVSATWKDSTGRTGVALPSGHRSNTSGQFWFFAPDNWELSIKVIDGCALNGRYWVMLSGTTNVEFHVLVSDIFHGNTAKEYSNPLGRAADAVLDTAAFTCAP